MPLARAAMSSRAAAAIAAWAGTYATVPFWALCTPMTAAGIAPVPPASAAPASIGGKDTAWTKLPWMARA